MANLLTSPFSRLVAALFIGASFSNCTSVPEEEQFFLTKENMLFEESLLFRDEALLVTAVEPGSNDASGAGGTGCATCQ